jgi:hypothetical protein
MFLMFEDSKRVIVFLMLQILVFKTEFSKRDGSGNTFLRFSTDKKIVVNRPVFSVFFRMNTAFLPIN